MNYDVLSILCGKQITYGPDIVIQGFTSGLNACMLGIRLSSDKAYSIVKSTVIDISPDKDGFYVVTTQCGADKWFRYCHLLDVAVTNNQQLSQRTFIGNTYRNELRFEYCNTDVNQHLVRVKNRTYYSHDPIGILYGLEQLSDTPDTVYVPSEEMKVVYEKPLNIYKNNLSSIINSPGR